MTVSGVRVPAAELVEESNLDPDALWVVRRLQKADHEAYLVGGCVRDLLIKRRPKDFDIATSATPNQVRRLFSNSIIIGRRFRLVHVPFRRKIIEVSTFRRSPESLGEGGDRLIVRDNKFGTAEEDALRRDFTINALFHDPSKGEIVDHVEGLPDIEARIIRTIGDPVIRIQEDPVRIIRAARFCAKIGFTLEPSLLEAMRVYAGHIEKSAPPRVQEEIFKVLESGCSRKTVRVLIDVGCFAHIYPSLADPVHPAHGEAAVEPEEESPDSPGSDDGLPDPEDRILDWDSQVPGEDGPVIPSMPTQPRPSPVSEPAPGASSLLDLLGALDEIIRENGKPPRSVLLAVLILNRVRNRTARQDAVRAAREFLTSLRTNNRVSRRDADFCAQIIAAQGRIFGGDGARRGRRSPDQMVRVRYFPEALVLADVETRARGEGREVVAQWQERMRQAGIDPQTVYHRGPSNRPRGEPRGRTREGGVRRRPLQGSERDRSHRGSTDKPSPPAGRREGSDEERNRPGPSGPRQPASEPRGAREVPPAKRPSGPRERSNADGTGQTRDRRGGDERARSGDRPAPVFNVRPASKDESAPKKKKLTHRARGWIRLTKGGNRPKRKRVARKRV